MKILILVLLTIMPKDLCMTLTSGANSGMPKECTRGVEGTTARRRIFQLRNLLVLPIPVRQALPMTVMPREPLLAPEFGDQ